MSLTERPTAAYHEGGVYHQNRVLLRLQTEAEHISMENPFIPLAHLEIFSDSTAKADYAKLVAGYAALYPEYAFERRIFSAKDINGIKDYIGQIINDNDQAGIATCYQGFAGMGKAAYWAGKAGVETQEDLDLFLNGDPQNQRGLDEKYLNDHDWLKTGFNELVKESPNPVEVIITRHDKGYDFNPNDNFVVRVWRQPDGSFHGEVRNGTWRLRDLEGDVPVYKITLFRLDQYGHVQFIHYGRDSFEQPVIKRTKEMGKLLGPLAGEILANYITTGIADAVPGFHESAHEIIGWSVRSAERLGYLNSEEAGELEVLTKTKLNRLNLSKAEEKYYKSLLRKLRKTTPKEDNEQSSELIAEREAAMKLWYEIVRAWGQKKRGISPTETIKRTMQSVLHKVDLGLSLETREVETLLDFLGELGWDKANITNDQRQFYESLLEETISVRVHAFIEQFQEMLREANLSHFYDVLEAYGLNTLEVIGTEKRGKIYEVR